jgi:cell division protein FtsL
MSHSGEATRSAYGSYFFAVVLVVFGLLVYLWGHVKTMRQGDELTQLRAERETLIRHQDRFRAEVAGLKRSSRIREIASKELGMIFPSEPPRNLYLKPDNQNAD